MKKNGIRRIVLLFQPLLLASGAVGAGPTTAPVEQPLWTSAASQWKPVANEVQAPAAGVKLEKGGLFRQAMDKHVAYLLADAKVDDMVYRFRQLAGVANPPGEKRGWENLFPAHAAQFLIGAGNFLHWEENEQLRGRMNALITAIKTCRTPDGLLACPAGGGEEGYSNMLLAHGLEAAAGAGNPDAHGLMASWAKWYRQRVEAENVRRPGVRAGAMGGPSQNYFGASGLMVAYFSPVGTNADVADAYLHVSPVWMRDLAAHNLESIWLFRHPHAGYGYAWTGFLDLYRATGDQRLLDAMRGGWDLYHHHWQRPGGTFAICEGGYKYFPDSLFITPQAHVGETCCMVWWAELNQQFHLLFPSEEKYVAEIEKVIYNVGLANQIGKAVCYHTHLENHKEYPEAIIHHCCEVVATYLYSNLPKYIYSIAGDGLYVNLYEPSSIEWKNAGKSCQLTMASQFPFQGGVSLSVAAAEPTPMKLRIRVPQWAAAAMPIKVNGQEVAVGKPGTYCTIDRTWRGGDTVTFTLPIELQTVKYTGADQIPEHDRYAILYGPILMAAVATLDDKNKVDLPDFVPSDKQKNNQKLLQKLKKSTYLVSISHDPADLKSCLTPIPNQPLCFTVAGQSEPYLKPYWQIEKESFTCFPVIEPAKR